MKVTMQDVARRAGVSVKTVSRVLNNEPHVSLKKRDCVIEAAETLRYSPNLAARGLVTSKSYLLALLYDNPSPSYIARIQRGAIDACKLGGYHLVVQPLTVENIKDREEKKTLIRSVLDRLRVDGVILTPPLCDSKLILETLEELGISYVRVGSDAAVGQGIRIGMDDANAAQKMTEYLIAQGHEKIGFISGHSRHAATAKRLGGYKIALKLAGIPVRKDLIKEGDFSYDSGIIAATKLLSRDIKHRPTVIFASNDDMAAAVINTAGHLRLNVPRDLSVCGFDDAPLAKILFPPLTTVQQPIYSMGNRAATMLFQPKLAEIHHSEPLLNFELKFRDSVAPPFVVKQILEDV